MYEGKRILVTGGTGSWGEELVQQLLHRSPHEIIVYSRNEHKQFSMKSKLDSSVIKFQLGDVMDAERLQEVCAGVDYVFHLAALKHVPVCEIQPYEALKINVIGTQNVIKAALDAGVKRVINVSTDKAADPSNFYGLTKAMAEKLIVSANLMSKETRFINVRGGNVLGTSGSVVDLFKDQIRRKSKVEITDQAMTRFFMTKEEAIELLIWAAGKGKGGETFIMKMPSFRIMDLAEVLIDAFGHRDVAVTNIGIRPGEKIHELLYSEFESQTTYEYNNQYYIMLPQIAIPELEGAYHLPAVTKRLYSSCDTLLAKPEIEQLLVKGGFM
ncbi:polysaccharide biosynthesis protein [Paenibacillus aurantiacus]|uniref:Polysaccharide biosynthesis protein n=1 Tax=Paenibacillus aurantiacus TaxID=1936118 RepID=A0ABV5KLQ5_9BACL